MIDQAQAAVGGRRPVLPDPDGTGRTPALTVHRARRHRIELYLDHLIAADGPSQWRWRYRHANGHQMANGGESYTRRIDAYRAVQVVTGFDLAEKPDQVEQHPGQDGDVLVWLVNPRSRRGFPG